MNTISDWKTDQAHSTRMWKNFAIALLPARGSPARAAPRECFALHPSTPPPHPDPELYFASEAAVLGDVDVFLSHSWHDSAQLKWDALQAWRAKFFKNHGREPVGRDEQTQGLSVSMFFAVA